LFADHLVASQARLDVLVNNACQTVRRPPGFSAHLLALEAQPLAALPPAWAAPLGGWEALREAVEAGARAARPGAPALEAGGGAAALLGPAPAGARAPGLLDPAGLSQLRSAWDGADGFGVFPGGRTDQDEQQVDL